MMDQEMCRKILVIVAVLGLTACTITTDDLPDFITGSSVESTPFAMTENSDILEYGTWSLGDDCNNVCYRETK